jgi:hypothetical protein
MRPAYSPRGESGYPGAEALLGHGIGEHAARRGGVGVEPPLVGLVGEEECLGS